MEDAEQWGDEAGPGGIDAKECDEFDEKCACPEPIAPKQHQRLSAQAKQAMQQSSKKAAGA